MFSLSDHEAKIANFNPRAEKHGESNALAGDIKFEVTGHSSMLDAFDAKLRPLLYRRPEKEGEQASLIAGDDLTALRRPELGDLSWSEDFPGYEIEIGNGLDVGKPLVLEADLSKFKFEPLNGGSVKVTFNATVHPDDKEAGRLCELIQDVVQLTVRPPQAEQPDMVDQAEQQTTADAAADAIAADEARKVA